MGFTNGTDNKFSPELHCDCIRRLKVSVFWLFFLMRFTAYVAEHLLGGIDLQKKEAQKVKAYRISV